MTRPALLSCALPYRVRSLRCLLAALSPLLFGLALAPAAVPGSAQAQSASPAPRVAAGRIRLEVDATDWQHKRLRVRQSLPVRPGPLRLLYPQWIPGNHAPTNEVKRLAGLRLEAGGQRLAWRRDPAELHAFLIDIPAGADRLDIAFDTLLPQQHANGGDAMVTRRYAAVQWQGAVLYPAGVPVSALPVDVSLRLPAGWQHGSALTLAGQDGDLLRFERTTLETLIDSPLHAAPYAKRIVLDDGPRPVTLHALAEDASSLEIGEPAIEAHRKLVQQADKLFGARHYRRYELLVGLGEEVPYGLEHHESSENGVKPNHFREWDRSAPGRDLVSHEYVHSWNGKFRRPRSLWAPDYNTATRNDLLWVYEGQTQYWGEVLAARSGLQSAEQVREGLARKLAWATLTPGPQWRPLQDTTFDEIMAGRRLRTEWTSLQRFDDYYDEGALTWLGIDARLREQSGGQRSLDDFARAFFGVEDGRIAPLLYDFEDVVRTLDGVERGAWGPLLRSALDDLGGRHPTEAVERAGWRLAWRDSPTEYGKQAEQQWESADFLWSIGIEVGKDNKLREVLWDSPAFQAGLGPGLELLAVNLRAYDADGLRQAITAAKDGAQPIELLLKDGSDYRIARIDWKGGLRYPMLERIEGRPDWLTPILSAR